MEDYSKEENPKLGVTVIFPMAGRGARFGYTFKPFLKIGDQTFIERAVSSFDGVKEHIKDIIFVYLKEQEEDHNVKENLERMFPNWNHRSVILEEPTKGPAETIRNAVQQDGNISGRTILCDCDHYLDVKPMFDHLLKDGSEECVVPIWDLEGESVKSWSVVSTSEDGSVKDIAEKEFPNVLGEFYGVIGCYYFRDILLAIHGGENVSETIKKFLGQGKKVRGIKIIKAEFFGDPNRLQKSVGNRDFKKKTQK